MIKAVLFDLDNTLLGNPNAVFVPAYLQLADSFFYDYWGVDSISRVLIQATRRMMADPGDLRQSNTALAQSLIAHTIGRSIDEVQAGFAVFYAEAYPQLRNCVESIPLAAEIVDIVRSQGLAVVIATNPMYPESAINQRLAWAGLNVDDEFALITHSDNMHFVKPNPAYFAEIIARVGIEPDEVIMVGDSHQNDIAPAALLGLSTFMVTEHLSDQQPDHVDSSGALADFLQLMRDPDWQDRWQPRPLLRESIEPQFQGNMGALFGLLAEVKPHQWHQHPDPNEWSITQAVCHLFESEAAVHRPRLQRILTEDNPFLSPRTPAWHDTLPCGDDGYYIAEQFVTERHKTIEWLRELQPNDWQRPARHSIFGLTTLLEMAQFTAQHDRLHISQICQTLGKCTP
jgi:HAD superfamily hydrolase (TIGR01549 family)